VLTLGRGGRQDEQELGVPQSLGQVGRLQPGIAQHSVRQPRVVDPDGRLERQQQRVQRPPQVAVAQDADTGMAQQDGVGVAGRDVPLASLARGSVLAGDAAGQIQGQRQRELRHGLRVRGAAAQHPDALGEGGRVVHIGEEVALDVNDRLESPRPTQHVAGEIGLTDDREGLRQRNPERGRIGIGLEVEDGEVVLQPLPGGGSEDAVPPLRRRTEENERSA
jgi:hypothetical protein